MNTIPCEKSTVLSELLLFIVKIDGVNHEFTSIPGVVEDVLDLLLNLKRLVLNVED